MAVINVAVTTKKYPFGICECTVDSDFDTGDFAHVGDFARVWACVVQSHVSLGMDY